MLPILKFEATNFILKASPTHEPCLYLNTSMIVHATLPVFFTSSGFLNPKVICTCNQHDRLDVCGLTNFEYPKHSDFPIRLWYLSSYPSWILSFKSKKRPTSYEAEQSSL